MTGQSEQMGDELRSMLSAAIAAVGPMLGQLERPDAPASACTWCPVCALVALSRGEQHALLTAIGVHGAALLEILRDVLSDGVAQHMATAQAAADADGAAASQEAPAQADPPPSTPPPAAPRPTFERITVTLTGASNDGPGR